MPNLWLYKNTDYKFRFYDGRAHSALIMTNSIEYCLVRLLCKLRLCTLVGAKCYPIH